MLTDSEANERNAVQQRFKNGREGPGARSSVVFTKLSIKGVHCLCLGKGLVVETVGELRHSNEDHGKEQRPVKVLADGQHLELNSRTSCKAANPESAIMDLVDLDEADKSPQLACKLRTDISSHD